MSGSHTPGASLTLTLWGTWPGFVCIHQLVPKPRSKATCMIQVASFQLILINTHHMMTMLFELSKQWQPKGRENHYRALSLLAAPGSAGIAHI